jgi:hypothetical protein
MRTTLTLDPRAAALVRKAMAERKQSFKAVVNDAIVRGLSDVEVPELDLPTFRLGPPLVNLDKATQLAGELDDADFLRKMVLGL